MPRWNATLDDGRVVTLEADNQPSEQDILSALDDYSHPSQEAAEPRTLESPSFWDKLRHTGPVEAVLGKTELERQGMVEGGGQGLADLAQVPLEFTKPGLPPVMEASNWLTEKEKEAASVLPEFAQGPANAFAGYTGGVRNALLQFPLAPLPAAKTLGGKGLLGLFTGEYLYQLPEAWRQFKSKLDEGDYAGAAQIAGENITTGGALGLAGLGTLKGARDAGQIAKAKTLPGMEVRPRVGEETPLRQGEEVRKEAAEPVLSGRPEDQMPENVRSVRDTATELDPQELAYLEAERKGMGIEQEFDVVPESGGAENQPFSPGEMARYNPETGRTEINANAYREALADAKTPEQAREIRRAILSEEDFHRRTAPDDATAYWNTLTWAEKSLERKLYSQGRKGLKLSDMLWGMEATRRRLQQLSRITTTEVAQLAGAGRLKVQSIEALDNVIRGIRESLGTAPSQEALSILRAIQGNLDTAYFVATGENPFARRKDDKTRSLFGDEGDRDIKFASWAAKVKQGVDTPEGRAKLVAESEKTARAEAELEPPPPESPAALRRWKPAPRREFTKGKDELELAGVARGQLAPEREVPMQFEPVTPAKVSESIAKHLTETKRPSFEDFAGEAQRRFGVGRAKLRDAWQDAVWKWLAKAPPAELERLRDELNLRKSLGGSEFQAPQPEARGFELKGEIEAGVRKEIESAEKQSKELIAERDARRRKAEAMIGNRLISEAYEEAKPYRRTEVEPEEITRWEPVPTQDLNRPDVLGKEITEGGGVSRTVGGKAKAAPETVSRSVVALVEPVTGKVHLVSAWRQGGVPMISDPSVTGLRKGVPVTADFLRRFKPIYAGLVDEPLKGFRKTYDSVAAFEDQFGETAKAQHERINEYESSQFAGAEGTAALEGEGGVAVGPYASQMRAVLGLGSGEFAAPKGPITRMEAQALLDRIMEEVSNYREPDDFKLTLDAVKNEPGKARDAFLKLIKETAGDMPEDASATEVIDRLSNRMFASWSFSDSPQEFVEKLSAHAPKEEVAPPTAPSETGRELTMRKRIPPTVDPRIRPKFTMPQRGVSGPAEMPAALAKLRGSAEDFTSKYAGWFKAWTKRDPTTNEIVARYDGFGTTARNLGREAANYVRLETADAAHPEGNPEVLAAANAVVQAGFDPSRLAGFVQKVNNGIRSAQAEISSPEMWRRRRGRAWLRGAEQLLKELEYARSHWTDGKLQDTAQRMKTVLDEQYRREAGAGYNIRYDQNYLPGRYEGELFNDDAVTFGERTVLGRQWRAPKTFPTYYHAIEAGPYVAVTRNGADLIEHRVRQGEMALGKKGWVEALKGVEDPMTGTPIALEPIRDRSGEWRSPNVEYEITRTGNYKPLAVRKFYADTIEQLIAPSGWHKGVIKPFALEWSQKLKHTILIGDFFHLGRLGYYTASIMGRKMGYKGGVSALDFREADLPEAVAKGLVRPQDAAWVTQSVPVRLKVGNRFTTLNMTRGQIIDEFQRQGLNVGRIQDALYKELTGRIPLVGRYNRWLFDKVTRGAMTQAAMHEFERIQKADPTADARDIMKRVIKDTNNFYGSIGRQGWIRSANGLDAARVLFLAPQWVEGLVKKEATTYYRGLTSPAAVLQGHETMARGIGRGLATMFLVTQALNLISRRQLTFDNDEKGHKLDAWIPSLDGTDGFWLSPFAIFNEITHDVIRLGETKPKVWDAINQIGENKLSPWGRAGLVLKESMSPTKHAITTTGGVFKEAASQLAPVPISFGRLGQAVGHEVAPGLMPPPPKGAVQRQLFGTGGIKIEPAQSDVQQISSMAQRYLKENKLKADPFLFVATDEPSYGKLRQAIRTGDTAGARKIYNGLLETHSFKQIADAMNEWSRRPFTGSKQHEGGFVRALSEKGRERYRAAVEQKYVELRAVLDFLADQ